MGTPIPLRVKGWEGVAGLIGVAFALIFVFSNASGIGFGLLCACGLWFLARVQIIERAGAAGRYARLRGLLGVAKTVLLLGIYAAVAYGLVIVHSDARRLRVGLVAEFALAGLAFLLLRELNESGNDALNWTIGARAERHVGSELAKLDSQWLVIHGYKRDWGGDIDHILSGPTGVYIVETKSYAFRGSDLKRTAWNAAWLKEKLSVPWVTAILCVNDDLEPIQRGVVWVMGHDKLVPWLVTQRNVTVHPNRLRERLLEPA
jgi:hypothetical protein